MSGLPYIIAYALLPIGETGTIAILHVIHTAWEWPPEEWPEGSR